MLKLRVQVFDLIADVMVLADGVEIVDRECGHGGRTYRERVARIHVTG